MTNEYGATLDRAGYAPSIMQQIPHNGPCACYLCGRPAGGEKMDRHEPWGGALRQKSKELGLWVVLHHWGCHEGPNGDHISGEQARQLRKDAQTAAMMRYGWSREEWIERFGKSELSEEECSKIFIVADVVRRAAPGAPVRIDIAERPKRETAGAGVPSRVAVLIREFWPDHQTTTRVSGFRLLPDADLPF